MPATSKQSTKFVEAKLLIAVLSLAVVVGLWALLANNAFGMTQFASAQAQDLSGIPTLVPLVALPSGPSDELLVSDGQSAGGSTALQLRSVTAPGETTVIQKGAPQVGSAVAQTGGGGGGSSRRSSRSTTTTRSSR